jgi:hypothetical protein
MPSYVYIEIDRTPPMIEIYAPSYTTNELLNEITIESNEDISDYQEIYVIDSIGNRHDYTFEIEGNKAVGIIKFSNIPIGISTIYARLKDDVGNISNRVYKPINIKESLTLLTISSSQKIRPIGASVKEIADRKVDMDEYEVITTSIEENPRLIEDRDTNMNIEITEENMEHEV